MYKDDVWRDDRYSLFNIYAKFTWGENAYIRLNEAPIPYEHLKKTMEVLFKERAMQGCCGVIINPVDNDEYTRRKQVIREEEE